MKIIGIDPGVHTGIAICLDGLFTEIYESDFWGAIEAFNKHPDAFVVVELPVNKAVYQKEYMKTATKHKVGVNVGSVIRESELLIKWLHSNKRDYMIHRPKAKKVDDKDFRRVTGWTGRTNQHKRDAALMCLGIKGYKLKIAAEVMD